MKKGATTFAKSVVYLVGTAALAICFILLPELAREEGMGKPINPYVTYGFFATVYVLATPFFVALYQTLKLLKFIENKKAFSQHSIKALKNIKYCAIVFSALIVIAVVGGISFARSVDPTEDVTAFISIGFILTFVSSVIAIFIAVLQKLLTDAVTLKSENDLII